MDIPGEAEPQQQHQDQDNQQQHDADSLLGLVLGNLDTGEGQACARALHRTSRSRRGTAVAPLKHLPLTRYHHGRARGLHLIHKMVPGSIPPAAASAAAVPPLPWRLLADVVAAGALTSLDISAGQVQHLLASSPTAAAEAAPAGEVAAAVSGLAATLSGLRCLRVDDITDEAPQLQQVGRLVGACSGLTQLVLATTYPPDEYDGFDCTLLEEGLELAAAAAAAAAAGGAAAAAAAAAAAGGRLRGEAVTAAAGRTQSVAAADQPAHWHLPHLQVLQLVGTLDGPMGPWMDHLEAPQLTSLQYEQVGLRVTDVPSLAACSGLRELVLNFPPTYIEMYVIDGVDGGAQVALPAALYDLAQLKALTKLVVSNCDVYGPVPPGVWTLTQLRHLELSSSWEQQQLPEEISCLKQLTYLGLSSSGLRELPADLGTWLPQLEVLVVPGTQVAGVPPNLTRLTKLDVKGCCLPSIAAVEHLTALKELQVSFNGPLLAWDAISKLTGLEVLSLTIRPEAAPATPGVLPRLRNLFLCAPDAIRRAAQLVGTGQHLTRLWLQDKSQAPQAQDSSEQAFAQLRVLPALQVLQLGTGNLAALALASGWLQQQPQLTSLMLRLPDPCEAPLVWHLPPGLRELQLIVEGGMPLSDMPDLSTQLSGLRVLDLWSCVGYELPGWVSRLQRLEKVTAYAEEAEVLGCRALAPLPLLRWWATTCMSGDMADALSAAPHLCWAQRCHHQ